MIPMKMLFNVYVKWIVTNKWILYTKLLCIFFCFTDLKLKLTAVKFCHAWKEKEKGCLHSKLKVSLKLKILHKCYSKNSILGYLTKKNLQKNFCGDNFFQTIVSRTLILIYNILPWTFY